jgi:hypothetical protein
MCSAPGTVLMWTAGQRHELSKATSIPGPSWLAGRPKSHPRLGARLRRRSHGRRPVRLARDESGQGFALRVVTDQDAGTVDYVPGTTDASRLRTRVPAQDRQDLSGPLAGRETGTLAAGRVHVDLVGRHRARRGSGAVPRAPGLSALSSFTDTAWSDSSDRSVRQ